MSILLNTLIFLWVTRTVKLALFWIYLWQLKEYHIGRFVDHFRTHKGRKIFLSVLPMSKIGLMVLLLLNYYFFDLVFWLILPIWAIETALFILAIKNRSLKKPVITLKTLLLISLSLITILVFIFFAEHSIASDFWLLCALLAFDILLPIIITMIVLAIQPLFVIARHTTLRRAKKKMALHKNITVVAITGSYGKTSTKEFLTTLLSEKFKVLSTPEHKNSEMGIAQTILQDLRDDHRIFIVEMGAYNKGGIDLLCNMVQPDIGVVTGVNEQHLATFGSLDNLLSAEGGRELTENLPGHGILIVNGENKHCVNLYKHYQGHKRIYALSPNGLRTDFWAEQIKATKDGVDFVLINHQKEMAHIVANVLGAHNVQNILAAVAVAKELGMTMEEISTAAKKISQKQGGMILKSGIHGISVIDSSYSSNPDGVVADLDYLKVFSGKKVVVMPCLIELGSESSRIHEQIGKKIAQVCDLAIITTKDKFKEISEGFMGESSGAGKILLCDNSQEIFTMITMMCKQGDAVLLEGRVPGALVTLLNGK